MFDLLFGSRIKMIAVAVIIGVVSTAIGGAYWYYTDTQDRLAEQGGLISQLEMGLAAQRSAIAQQQSDAKLQSTIHHDLQKEFSDAREEIAELRMKFNKTTKLLGENRFKKLAVAKPLIITKIINSGSADVARCFEILSGQPLTEREKSADRPSLYNSACADVANPKKNELNN